MQQSNSVKGAGSTFESGPTNHFSHTEDCTHEMVDEKENWLRTTTLNSSFIKAKPVQVQSSAVFCCKKAFPAGMRGASNSFRSAGAWFSRKAKCGLKFENESCCSSNWWNLGIHQLEGQRPCSESSKILSGEPAGDSSLPGVPERHWPNPPVSIYRALRVCSTWRKAEKGPYPSCGKVSPRNHLL